MTTGAFDVAVVGAGPVGLTLALRLAGTGVRVVVLEARARLSGEGSKALCMQRETLESWARLGIGETVADLGVAWTLGRTYYRGTELFTTTFPEVGREHFPPFVNVSQSEVERLLVERCETEPRVELRWEHRVVAVDESASAVTLEAETPEGPVSVAADYAVAADGAHSDVRRLLGIDFHGHSHADRFLIADIRAHLPFPDERRFYFDPPWNPGRTVLVHPQPDSVWRIDWQVPPDLDLDAEQASGRLDTRIRRIVGNEDYELVWLTLYRFHQRVAADFRCGRVFLAGDSAHVVSPFGARGLNSGVADAENLAWKLAHVLRGVAPADLLDTYGTERRAAALENLAVTDATMRFMVPPDRARLALRNAVLRLSRWWPAARRRVDSGRLCQPHRYEPSAVVEPGGGQVAPDGPVTVLAGPSTATRLREVVDDRVVGLLLVPSLPSRADLPAASTPLVVVVPPAAATPTSPVGCTVVRDDTGAVTAAYCPQGVPAGGHLVVVRPDWHVASRRDLASSSDLSCLDDLAGRARGARTGSPVPGDSPRPTA